MKTHFIAAALAVGSLSSFVQADIDTSNIDEVVVISSRQPVPLRQLGTSVSRMDEAEISERGYFGLADLLRTLPSIGVSNSGGLGQPTTLRIRGEEGFRTLVLVDGMDISDPSPPQASPRMQHLPSAGISSIEVLRGPQGMMYGADAGGVVSIRTVSPEPGVQSSVRIDGGRYGTQQSAVSLGGKGEQGDFYLFGSRLESDGFNARREDTVLADDDGYENTTVHGRLGWQLSDSLRLEAVARDVKSESEYDRCYTPVFELTHRCFGEFDQRSYRARLEYSGPAGQHSLAVQQTKTTSADYAEGEFAFASDGEIRRLEYQAALRLSDTLDLLFGLDHKREQMRSDGGDRARSQIGYFAELQNRPLEQWFVTLGLRHDDNDDFGRHGSYRLSTAYLIPVGTGNLLKLKASAGSGFRAPSLYEVAYNISSSAYPPAVNVELKEEESSGFDVGLEYYLGEESQLELVFFDQKIKGEIYFDPVDWSGYLQSQGRSESRGVELSGQHRISDLWAISASMSFNETRTMTGEPRVHRPRQMANITLSAYPLNDLVVHLNWRAARRIIAHDSSGPMDNYQLVDISARYQPVEMLTLYGRIENAADEEYQEVLGYNTSGRAGYLGFEFKF